jgi:hypothetical protein
MVYVVLLHEYVPQEHLQEILGQLVAPQEIGLVQVVEVEVLQVAVSQILSVHVQVDIIEQQMVLVFQGFLDLHPIKLRGIIV